MGAIFGVCGLTNPPPAERLKEKLAHRGAKAEILDCSPTTYLAALAPTTPKARQAACRQGNVGVVVDGRVIAAAELDAAELFRQYRERGRAAFAQLEGEFAFAVCDGDTLLLGRDFLGIRPLYYTVLPHGAVAFASEYKAILDIRPQRPTPDLDMLQYLQERKRLPTGRTLVKEVLEVPPGTLLAFDLSSGKEVARTAFTAAIGLDIEERSVPEARSEVYRYLCAAIERRIGHLDPLGIALSGGIDSIGVACLARNLYPDREIHTFTAGFGPDDIEMVAARQAAAHIGSVHHEVETPPDLLLTDLPKLVWHLEDPFSRSEALQLLKVAEAASGKVEALVSAQGADGLFAGMPKHKILALMARYPILARYLGEIYSFTQVGAEPSSAIGRLLQMAYFRGDVPTVPRIAGAAPAEPFRLPPLSDEFINLVTSSGFQSSVCQDVHKFERSFSAQGLGYTSPFYDMRLIRFAYTISDRLKVRGSQQKWILRRALDGVVPPALIGVPKLPQRMRYDSDFTNVLDQLAARHLNRDDLARQGLFVPDTVDTLWNASARRPYPAEWAMRIWTAVLTSIWFDTFMR